ncbi:MAG: PhnB protein [Chloroflexota bacterium]|nr:PhnB protein [Chloroflexota bacterium]
MSHYHIRPYVNFQGRAREAMELYRNVFGGTLELLASDENGKAKPAGPGDRITHARLEADGASIVGTDGHPDYPAKVGENVAIAVSGTNRDQMARFFDGLSEGGMVKMKLVEQGFLADKFGINWVFTIEKE